MDLSKLKNKPAYPFETIAAAIAFSPRLELILSEAKHLADVLDAHLLLFHIGEKSVEKENQLEQMMAKYKINPEKTRVIWMEGDPVETILKLSKLNIVDLLILGALEKENLLKYYMGSIARSISRKAKCSVLLLIKPLGTSKGKKYIVTGVDNPKTVHTINTALYLASHLNIRELTIIQETHTPGLAMTIAENSTAPEANKIKKDINAEQHSRLNEILEKCNYRDIKINDKIIQGKPGFAIRNYADSKNADLLVINSPDTKLGILDRIFAHDIEYILEDLPSNLLIVHSRI